MTEDRKTPSAEHLKGSVKEAIGKLTGDARTETEGRRQKRDAPGSDAPRSGAGGSGPAGSGPR
ncbi:CsbD family protein [Methylobacterium oryzae]|uniref:CsbD family protein n=1 Tax=Methylobacterium oryzae TaxID=334852 RepID=UPI002F344CAF